MTRVSETRYFRHNNMPKIYLKLKEQDEQDTQDKVDLLVFRKK